MPNKEFIKIIMSSKDRGNPPNEITRQVLKVLETAKFDQIQLKKKDTKVHARRPPVLNVDKNGVTYIPSNPSGLTSRSKSPSLTISSLEMPTDGFTTLDRNTSN